LAQQINALYRQAVAGFRVEVLPNLEVEDLSGNVTFSNADNAFLSRYTSHMNKVIRTFKRAGNPLDGNTYYLFLIPNPTTDPRQGYMPINGQCGFIFLNNVSAEGVARVAAHELGHGVFRLYHTFSSDNRYVLPEGTTDNLMDYNGGTALYKYQWDYIHDPQTMLFAWAEEEEEGAMIGIPDIIKQIREANTRGEKMLKIVQDKCQKWAIKNFKLGNGQKLSYIHLSCSDKLEEPFPFEEGYSGNFDWSSIVNSSALYIDPSEISKVSTIGTKDNKRYVRYQFHELNMPANVIELPTLTDNVLFHFVVLEEEADKFENYLFGLKNKLISVNLLSISDDGIKDLILHEGKVNHVYNDAKGANSYYCEEHKGHAKIPEGMYQCKEKEHENSNGTIGNPTIGVGHLIVGENELQKYCEKGIISSEEVEELLKEDIIYKAEKPLINAINEYVKDAKLNQCQFDALVSIVFNRGIGCETCKNYPNGIGFKNSDLWNNYIKKGVFYSDDPDENIEIKNKIINDGSILAGSNRRKDEAEMYFNCDYKSKK
jgi:GH24 family phage-related lysozyme (muramidase)